MHEVEHAGVQGLIEGSLHASTKALSAAARTVLEGFTSQRTKPGVEAMLFRLHEPLIFRALQVGVTADLFFPSSKHIPLPLL